MAFQFFRKKKSTQGLADSELVELYKKTEDKEVATELFMRYTHLLLGVCMKYLKDEENARDAVMQIYEKLLTDLSRHEIQNFKGWLHTVARNHCLMQLRKNHATEEISADNMEFSYSLHPYENNEDVEIKIELLEECLNELNEAQKVCIQLFYLEDKSYKDITAMTGYTLNDVKSHIQNGKRNLKNFMNKKYEQS